MESDEGRVSTGIETGDVDIGLDEPEAPDVPDNPE